MLINDIDYFLTESDIEFENIFNTSHIKECVYHIENLPINELMYINEDFKSSIVKNLKALLEKIKKIISIIKREYERNTIPPKLANLKENRRYAVDPSKNTKMYYMYRYDKTVNTLMSSKVPSFNYTALKDDLETDRRFLRRYFKEYFIPGTTFINSTRAIFRGSAEPVEFSAKSINYTSVYNFCINYRSNLDEVNKNMKNVKKAAEEAIRKIERMDSFNETFAFSSITSKIVQKENSYGLSDELLDKEAIVESISNSKEDIRRTKRYIDICFKFLGIKMAILRESFAHLHVILLDNIASNKI